MIEKDKLFKGAVVCYDDVPVKDDDDREVRFRARWNEVMTDVVSGERLPAWKWQLWVDTRGEVQVRTADDTTEGFVWPRKGTV